METKVTKVAVELDKVNIGDTVFLDDKEKSVPYFVVDKGTPFIMVENTKSHFCSLYRVVKPLYKII